MNEGEAREKDCYLQTKNLFIQRVEPVQLAITISLLLIFTSFLPIFQNIFAEEYRTWFEKDYDWDEFYDDGINRQSVEEACDASEDYEKHKKACDKAYDKIEEQEEASREAYPYIIDKSPLPNTQEYQENVVDKLTEEQKEKKQETIEKYHKEACEDSGAEWEDGACDTKGDDEKADEYRDKTRDIKDDEEQH